MVAPKGLFLVERGGNRHQFDPCFAGLPVGVYLVQDGRSQCVNAQFEKVAGYNRAELLGTQSLSLVAPEDRPQVQANAIGMLKGSRSIPYQYRLTTKAGEQRWIQESIALVVHQGRAAALGFCMDVTSLMYTQEAERDRARELELFSAVASALTRPGVFREKAERVLESLVATDHASHAILMVHDDNLGGLRPMAEAGSARAISRLTVRDPDSASVAVRAFQRGETLVADPGPAFAAQETQSMAALPIVASGRKFGVLVFASRHADHFTPERVKLLTAVASGIGPFLESVSLADQISLKSQEVERVLEQLGGANNQLEALNQSIGARLNTLFDNVSTLVEEEGKQLEELARQSPGQLAERSSQFLAKLRALITQ